MKILRIIGGPSRARSIYEAVATAGNGEELKVPVEAVQLSLDSGENIKLESDDEAIPNVGLYRGPF